LLAIDLAAFLESAGFKASFDFCARFVISCGGLPYTSLMAANSSPNLGSVAKADCGWKLVVAVSARNFGF
jgi:hypothetical protein